MPYKKITADQKSKLFAALNKGHDLQQAAALASISVPTARTLRKKAIEQGHALPPNRGPRGSVKGPVPYKDLGYRAKKALKDFDYFQLRYFGRIAVPWQKEMAETVAKLEATSQDEYVVTNVAPGAGKSSTLIAIVCWMICRRRDIRILYGSYSQGQAEWYTAQIRSMLSSLVPQKASPKDIALGIAQDAEATLVDDFGRFKPEEQDIWKRDQFYVEQFPGYNRVNKEATVQAFGMDTAFIGGRYDLCIWDDVYDKSKLRTWEMKERQREWWTSTAETRLDPAGLLVLQGQRLDPEDIYHFALNLQEGDWDEDGAEEQVAEDGNPVTHQKYHHIVYPAHFEQECKGKEFHKESAPAWPQGCLLYPRRITWRKVQQQMTNNPENFRLVYQQEDIDPKGVLVDPLWVSGGTDKDGVEYPGCWDSDRGIADMWGVPTTDIVSLVTVDPSPTQMWGLLWMIYHGPSQHFYLMDIKRKRMTAPEFLDFDMNTQRFSGMIDDWVTRAKQLRAPISHLVLEINAAQRFMMSYAPMQQWLRMTGINLVKHTTAKNKHDSEYGVRSIGPEFRHGRVRLPGRQRDEEQSRMHSIKLVEEVTHTALDGSFMPATTDLTMAMWFGVLTAPTLYRPNNRLPQYKREGWIGSGRPNLVAI